MALHLPGLVLLALMPLAAMVAATYCHGRAATAAITHRMMNKQKQNEQKKLATLLEAHAALYSGLNDLCAGNADAVLAVWSHAADVTDFGPDGQKHVGWQAIEAQFRKEGDEWKLVHHHADSSVPMESRK